MRQGRVQQGIGEGKGEGAERSLGPVGKDGLVGLSKRCEEKKSRLHRPVDPKATVRVPVSDVVPFPIAISIAISIPIPLPLPLLLPVALPPFSLPSSPFLKKR